MDMYREEILEHWQNPQNFGVLKNADLVIEQVNPLCGDEIAFYFKFFTPLSSSSLNCHSRESGNRDKLQRGSGFSIKSRMTKESSRHTRTIIKDVKFTGSGCAISIASASILSENIKNKKISTLSKITGEDVLKLIGGSVAPARLKCAFLSLEVIRKISF